MDLLSLLEKLPAYIHYEDEPNRLFLQINRDIQGKWQMCYETEGRCYYPTTDKSLETCALELKEKVKAH